MKFVISVIIIVGLAMGGYRLHEYWGKFKTPAPDDVAAAPAAPPSTGDELPGLLPRLQPALDEARRRGAAGLRDFLAQYGNTINDPRKAWIELDYVVLEAQSNPAEASRVFARVKSRVTPDSPIYPRVQQLEKTYD